MPNEQVIPEAALRDPKSVEMLRVWIAEKKLWCSLRIGMYRDREIEEAGSWGIILADVARHIANALAESENRDRSETLQRIRELFTVELGTPTSPVSGDFAKKN